MAIINTHRWAENFAGPLGELDAELVEQRYESRAARS